MEERKTVLVTGASRGIGKEVALKYAENGYDIIINYVSDKTDVETLENEFKEKGVNCLIGDFGGRPDGRRRCAHQAAEQ